MSERTGWKTVKDLLGTYWRHVSGDTVVRNDVGPDESPYFVVFAGETTVARGTDGKAISFGSCRRAMEFVEERRKAKPKKDREERRRS